MLKKEDYTESSKANNPFEFSYTRPSLDWYEVVNVSITYDAYDYLTLERRYGGMWWVKGKKYIEDKNKWVSEEIGEIREEDIPRLVEWAEYTDRFGHQVSILREVRAIDGCLNPIREFLKIMSKHKAESEGKKSNGSR